MDVLLASRIPDFGRPTYAGKVRDTYDLGDTLLIVATDRISVFDVVLPTGIPGKGKILTQLSAWWFERTSAVVPNHFLRLVDSAHVEGVPFEVPRELWGRSMLVRKADRVDVECVVRGYLAGSAWEEYQARGTVQGFRLPAGLREGDALPEPLFTPTTKALVGHDEPLTRSELVQQWGAETAHVLHVRSGAIYRYGAEVARHRGIIIADTKLEFGFIEGELSVIDEMLTPDSSRFWDEASYRPGGPPPSFDKQFVRDYVASTGWNKEPPGPELPPDIVARTAEKYVEAYRRLTGEEPRL